MFEKCKPKQQSLTGGQFPQFTAAIKYQHEGSLGGLKYMMACFHSSTQILKMAKL